MDAVRRFSKPLLRRPRAMVAFEGWNDAAGSASGSLEYILGQIGVTDPFAVLDPEEFFDFQVRRPTVSIGDGGTRSLTWPNARFFAVPLPSDSRDLVVVLGEEPSFRWRTFARLVTGVLADTDVEDVVFLGAFVGQVPHTRPVPIVGVATDPDIVTRHGLLISSYEGPTGIIGVLQEACREVGIPAVSLWAATPHYLAANANPKAMLALLDKARAVLSLEIDLTDLSETAEAFETRVTEAMQASEDLSEYVAGLENEDDTDEDVDVEDLVDEIENFLRGQD